VTRHFFVWAFRIAPRDLKKLKLNALMFYSCRSSRILASDQGERCVKYPTGHSADSVYQPSAATPLFFFYSASLLSIRRYREEA
jgi:hypothetical protein